MSQSAPSMIGYSQTGFYSSNIALPVEASYNYIYSHESDAPGPNHHQAIPDAIQTNIGPTALLNPFNQTRSRATQNWHLRKLHGEKSNTLDELMQYQGLEAVKQHFLDLKSMVDIWKKQDPEETMDILKQERFNIVFQGNPGTGKTVVARIYAKFLNEMKILHSDYIKETSGVNIALGGGKHMKNIINYMKVNKKGGVIFMDEAYQLMSSYVDGNGKQALDVLLTALENNLGSIAAIFVGYKDEMVSFFEHNPGLESRIPYVVNFTDFSDGELWQILVDKIKKQYQGKMRVEGGFDGLYMRIVIRRLAQARGCRNFGNARAVENLLVRIKQRQARRLAQEKIEHCQYIDYFLFTKEDLIGPNPSAVARLCPAWIELYKLIGLEEVKKSVETLIGMVELNYQRELLEGLPIQFSLNQVFVGAPGTGKTTVAKLYGQILAELGYLSCGDVVLKTPADFIGDCLGKSETKTRQILESTVGKVLIIDEAYMLDAGDSQRDQDKFKAGIIDTIVSMTHGLPNEDRCIILVGYKDKIREMFQNANPGLSRRFPIEHPFHFENFNVEQLKDILILRAKEDNLVITEDALLAAQEIFTRALMRPNFTNAGEVNNMFAAAKMRYATRLLNLPMNERIFATALEAVDFDPEAGKRDESELACEKMLDGAVDSRIIDKIASYQHGYRMATKLNLSPRAFVPTNFIFKGPPGTGKTTTAKQMGKIFYNMGFVSTNEVIECTVTDLVGQYVGQTAPMTKKKLQEGLGRVLIIDEANRLINGSYASEAVDELLSFLANPSNTGNMIIILVGLTAEMDKLLSQYPVLSNFFPDEITFENISPDDCIKLLIKELKGIGIHAATSFLLDHSKDEYCKIRQLFRSLSVQQCWGNARDVKALAKQITTRFISTQTSCALQKEISMQCVTESMEQMIALRKGRMKPSTSGHSSSNFSQRSQENPQQVMVPQQVPATVHTGKRKGVWDTDRGVDNGSAKRHQGLASYMPPSQSKYFLSKEADTPLKEETQQQPSTRKKVSREDGVSDTDWEKICSANTNRTIRQKLLELQLAGLQRDMKSDENKEDSDYMSKLQDRLEQAQSKIKKEEEIQNALHAMGRCVMGYAWTKQDGGYRCEGGSHFVSDEELATKL
ncbi:uncharacterized protein Triagg1_3328 [Trichoderma aggressivum f. europaeum]|uniref:AAA+ ATPase domain-containing protein n=1 Tax=Trichoderma aggressivum f. europaeum TaxID=173218 RepID=A0AAE1IFP3_9HYPO|nr:hypothetical protein Triagg1_3328 [Trichoderma aggressivum f. europaeum]